MLERTQEYLTPEQPNHDTEEGSQSIPLTLDHLSNPIHNNTDDAARILELRKSLQTSAESTPATIEQGPCDYQFGNLKIRLGRPESEIKGKWSENKSKFGVRLLSTRTGNHERFKAYLSNYKVQMGLQTDGVFKVHDGNTKFYGAMELGLRADEIPVICTIGDKTFEGTLEGLLDYHF